MKTATAAFVLAIALAGAGVAQTQTAPAAEPTAVEPLTVQAALGVQGLIGNTIVDRSPDGTWWIQLHRDGVYDTYLNGGLAAHGVWTYDSGKLCYNPGATAAFCAKEAMGGRKVGDSWTTTGPDGKRYDAAVVKGQLGG